MAMWREALANARPTTWFVQRGMGSMSGSGILPGDLYREKGHIQGRWAVWDRVVQVRLKKIAQSLVCSEVIPNGYRARWREAMELGEWKAGLRLWGCTWMQRAAAG